MKNRLEILESTMFTKGEVVAKSRMTLGVIGTKGVSYLPQTQDTT